MASTTSVDDHRLTELANPDDGVGLHSHTCHNTMEDVERMKKLLEEDPTVLNFPLKSSPVFKVALPLHDAAFKLHDKCVEFILRSGADVNSLSSVHENAAPNLTALHYAITSPFNKKQKRQYNVIKLLLDHGASPNNIFNLDFKNTFFIDQCILFQMNDILKLLLKYGADTHVKESIHTKVDLGTPLAKCILSWNIEALKLLLLHNAKDMIFNYEMINPENNEEPFNWTITSVVHMIAIETGFQYLKAHDNEKQQKIILEIALKFFTVYKAFRGSLWELQCQLCCCLCNRNVYENVIQYLEHRTPSPCGFDNEFIKILKKLMYNPPSLKSLARNAIQESMDQSYVKNIHKLDIPQELKNYLLYNELDTLDVNASDHVWTLTQISIDDLVDLIMNDGDMPFDPAMFDIAAVAVEESSDEEEDEQEEKLVLQNDLLPRDVPDHQ